MKFITYYLILNYIFIGINLSYSQKKWSLDDCISYAIEKNISIKKSILDYDVSEQNIYISKAELLPNVYSTASQTANIYFSNQNSFNSFIPNPSSLNNYTTNFTALNVNYTVFKGKINKYAFQKAKVDNQIASNQLELLKNNIILDVTYAYLNYLLAEEFVNIATNQLSISKSQLNIVSKRIKAGITPESNVYGAEAAVAQDEENLLKQNNNKRISLLKLKQLLQMPLNNELEIDVFDNISLTELMFDSSNKYYTEALKNRPEIKTAELTVKSAELNIKIAKGSFLPTVSLNYLIDSNSYHFNKVNSEPFFDQLDNNLKQTALMRLSIPLFNGKKLKSNKNISKIAKEKAILDLDNVKYSLQQEIEQMYVDIKNAELALKSSEKTLKAREIDLEYSKKRFSVGNINNFDFDKAKNDFILANANYIQAKYNYWFKIKVLHYYSLNNY